LSIVLVSGCMHPEGICLIGGDCRNWKCVLFQHGAASFIVPSDGRA